MQPYDSRNPLEYRARRGEGKIPTRANDLLHLSKCSLQPHYSLTGRRCHWRLMMGSTGNESVAQCDFALFLLPLPQQTSEPLGRALRATKSITNLGRFNVVSVHRPQPTTRAYSIGLIRNVATERKETFWEGTGHSECAVFCSQFHRFHSEGTKGWMPSCRRGSQLFHCSEWTELVRRFERFIVGL